MVYQDAKKGVILDIKATSLPLTLDQGLTYVTFIAVAAGVGDILILALTRPYNLTQDDPYVSYQITEVAGFFLADTKIINLFLFKEL